MPPAVAPGTLALTHEPVGRNTTADMDTPPRDPMDDPRRRAILRDRGLHDEIRKIARLRGVPRFEVDAILSAVILDSMDDEKLPLDDREQARLYLTACARNKSIDEARKRTWRAAREVEADPNQAAPGAASAFDKALAKRMLREGNARFPKTFHWFLRNTVARETALQIAVDNKVHPGYVRAELTRIRLTLVSVLVIVAGVFFVRYWHMPGGHAVDHDRDMADTAKSVQPPPPPPPQPSTSPAPSSSNDDTQDVVKKLRDRAKERSAVGDWKGCVEALDAANTVLGTGEPEPDDVAKLHRICQVRLLDNVKPGAPQH